MPFIKTDRINIAYELRGSGPNVVLTSGAHFPMESLREMAKAMASFCTVLIYDRRNTGQSDINWV